MQNAHALTRRRDSGEDGTGRGTPVIVTQDKANTLTKRMHKGINTTVDEGQTPVICAAVAYTKAKRAQSSTDDESWVPGRVAPTMNGFDVGEGRATTVVAMRESGPGDGVANTLQANSGRCQSDSTYVPDAMAVRRLTPRECERLQGFPDGYTAIEFRNKPAADSPRYKALGNSMAVPVMRWIGERICMVDAMLNKGGQR